MLAHQRIRHIKPNIMPGAGILGSDIANAYYQELTHKGKGI
jgi:hypothetical protein